MNERKEHALSESVLSCAIREAANEQPEACCRTENFRHSQDRNFVERQEMVVELVRQGLTVEAASRLVNI